MSPHAAESCVSGRYAARLLNSTPGIGFCMQKLSALTRKGTDTQKHYQPLKKEALKWRCPLKFQHGIEGGGEIVLKEARVVVVGHGNQRGESN